MSTTISVGTKCQLYTGRMVDPLNMTPKDICLEDIAHALGHICRFGGHCSRFMSVAEHSVNVAHVATSSPPDGVDVNVVRLAALLHDASEAYLNDISRPLKQNPEFSFYRQVEAQLMTMIYEKYIPCGPVVSHGYEIMETVKRADDIMLGIEARDLMGLALRAPGSLHGSVGSVGASDASGNVKKKISPGAQRAWQEAWGPYLKLIPDDLYYRIDVTNPPSLAFRAHGYDASGMWLEMVRRCAPPGVVWE